MNDKVPKIVFIDDGINSDVVPEDVIYDSMIVNEGEVKKNKPLRVISHGTQCYKIFRDRVQMPYHLISIKVLNSTTGTGMNKTQLAALHWCAEQKVDLINMSIGTRQYRDFAPIIEAVNNLPHTLIVAACNNSNTLTFPACLPKVIGVRHCKSAKLRDNFAFIENPYDQVDIATCVKNINIFDESNGLGSIAVGNSSFAAPIITARVCDYIAQGHTGIDAIRQKLKIEAAKDIPFLGYNFYKCLLSTWEDISIPIVALLIKDALLGSKLKDLLNVFIQDGYRAIALSQYSKTNVSDLIFQLNWQGEGQVSVSELIELYYNFTLPDILFLHMDLQSLLALQRGLQTDLIIKSHDTKIADDCWDDISILDINESAEHLLIKIKNLLS